MIRYFLLIDIIIKIDWCIVGIEVYFHPNLVLYLGYFNSLENTLYKEKLVISQIITLNKSMMTWKKDLVIATLNIKYD